MSTDGQTDGNQGVYQKRIFFFEMRQKIIGKDLKQLFVEYGAAVYRNDYF